MQLTEAELRYMRTGKRSKQLTLAERPGSGAFVSVEPSDEGNPQTDEASSSQSPPDTQFVTLPADKCMLLLLSTSHNCELYTYMLARIQVIRCRSKIRLAALIGCSDFQSTYLKDASLLDCLQQMCEVLRGHGRKGWVQLLSVC